MLRILPFSIPAAVLGSMLRLDAAPPMVLEVPARCLSTGAICAARALGPGPDATITWSISNGVILAGQGTAGVSFQAGNPGPLNLTCAAGGPSATATFMVLPPLRAELFAPARAHVGDRFAVSMPVPFIRSWLWEPVTGAGTALRYDPGVNPLVVGATATGTLQVTGTAEDQAGASDTGSARVEVVQGDFANPGGVLAAWGPATAARLASGRVLVVEGRGAGLFDPLTNTWRPAAPLLADHGEGHTETLLGDGTVLVTGGAGALAATERYDPATGRWTAGGDLILARSGHTATLLKDGTVLVAGGRDGQGGLLGDPERYDPETSRWTLLAPSGLTPPAARIQHTATLLEDGRVLIAGGSDPDGASLRSAELYDPAGNSWGPAARPNGARALHSATLLDQDGSVLVAGGYDGLDQLASAERYDPVRNVWSPAAAMAVPRDAHGAAGLAGGKVLVLGGECATGVLGGAELYDPGEGPGRADGWIPQAQLLLARAQPCTVALADGRVLVACGRNLGSMLSSPELFSPGGGAWVSAGGGDARARSAHTATLLGDGTVLVAGGSADAQAIAGAQRFDPAAQSWRDTGNPLAQPRMNHSASLLPDGSVLAVGGVDDGSNLLASAERYDPLGDRWTPAGFMAEGRELHQAAVLDDGRVLVTGGLGGEAFLPLATAELFDGSLWVAAPPMATARYEHTATPLADGTVLVAGGRDGADAPLAGAERYDPAAGAWSVPPAMRVPRACHTATRLPNGQVLVVGGFSGAAATGSVERFDPGSNRWLPAASLGTARGNHTATLVNGKVLVTGGTDLHQELAGAELYDPATDTWTDGGTLDSPRFGHTATLLQDGVTVAVFGGEPLQANLELWK